MACWRGVCRAGRGWLRGPGAGDPGWETRPDPAADAPSCAAPAGTWTAPPPSPAYLLSQSPELLGGPASRAIPPDLLGKLQGWREQLLVEQARPQAAAALQSGPLLPPKPEAFELIITEEGTGQKRPGDGDAVRLGYAVAAKGDGDVVVAIPELEYCIGRPGAHAGQLAPAALERVLREMKPGQVASVSCTLQQVLVPSAPALAERGPEAPAVLEVKLFLIHSSKDCSFTKGTGEVLKDVLKDGLGTWCDNPTDEGQALLRIEEVRSASGQLLFPLDGARPLEMLITPGDGEVCDALECAILEMRHHETALVTCSEPALCTGGAPLGAQPPHEGATIRVSLLEFSKGPDVWALEEEDRLTFALRRKEVATRLFKEGRYRLARERYKRMEELFHHLQRPKSGDRFLGKPELYTACKELRKVCRLNAAACSIRLADPLHAKRMCDAVLRSEPENTKALYRRAQAHSQRGDYLQACNDLERLLDIDGGIDEARRLLERARRLRHASDRQQRKQFNYNRMIDKMRTDPRSIVNDYMDTPVDLPGMEGTPIAERFKPKPRQ